MSTDPSDYIQSGVLSNCCGAVVWEGDICSDCKEHCEAEPEEDDGPSDAMLERLQDSAYRAEEKAVLRADQDERDLRDAGRGHLLP